MAWTLRSAEIICAALDPARGAACSGGVGTRPRGEGREQRPSAQNPPPHARRWRGLDLLESDLRKMLCSCRCPVIDDLQEDLLEAGALVLPDQIVDPAFG